MFVLHLGLPSALVEEIAPKQVASIASTYDVVFAPGHEVFGNLRQISVTGDNALAALGTYLQVCTEVAFSQTDEIVLHLYIPVNCAGRVVGKNGANITDFRTRFQDVRFKLESDEEDINLWDASGLEAEAVDDSMKLRTMTITGRLSAASNALLEVAHLVQNLVSGVSVREAKRMRMSSMAEEDPYGYGYYQRGMEQEYYAYNDDSPPCYEGKLTITIPSVKAGHIIGKGGSTISQIRQSTGCKVEVEKHPKTQAPNRHITCTGGLLELENCLHTIRNLIEEQANL